MSDVKGKTGAVLRETAVLTGAVAIIAAGVFFFLVPSHTSVSSISGLGIVLSNFVPLPLSVITMILNVVLPVSYTHLDVYKRQELGSSMCRTPSSNFAWMSSFFTSPT